MKKNIFFAFAMVALLSLFSCEKDETRAILKDDVSASSVSAPTANAAIVLNRDNQDAVTVFTWTAVDYGFQASITYTLQAVYNDVTEVQLAEGSNILTASISASSLNKKLIAAGVVGGTTVPLKIRVISNVQGNSSLATLGSEVNVTVATYSDKKTYDWIYLVGNFQGWNAGAPNDSIKSEIGAKLYEGYVFMTTTDADIQGKFNQHKGWDTGFCWGLGASAGVLSNDGGAGNIPFASPAVAGTYHLTADLNGLTYSKELFEVGIIGSATPTSWGSDTKLKYNNELDVWELGSIALTGGGEIKFRKNSAWDIAWGGTLDALSTSGGNIAVATSGNYSVTLDLKSTPMTCKLKLVQ